MIVCALWRIWGDMMKKKILAYVGSAGDIINEDVNKLTDINIAFGRLYTDGTVDAASHNKVQMIPKIREWNKDLNIILSLVPGEKEAFTKISSDKAIREKAAKSIADIVKKYDLDGIDLDWEFPCFPSNGVDACMADKTNFTLLCEAIRRHLDDIDGRHYIFSIAAGADLYYVKSVELPKLIEYLDYICLMTYDLKCGFHALAGHHTALYSNLGDVFMNSCDQALRLFVQNGVPKEKLLMGAAFYSRKWENIKDRNHGLLQISKQGGGYGPDYDCLAEQYINKNGFIRYWDEEAKAPYLFDGSTFISYDDEESMTYKASYVKKEGYAGIFYWEHKCDKTRKLLNAIVSEFNNS